MDVEKKDGSMEAFDKNKIAKGCEKSGASADVAKKVALAVSKKATDGISTIEIAEMVIAELHKLDHKAAASFEKYFRNH
ncbi:MAG: ATP cone domain-containing protein [Candidatus Aenigmatarchaeota archaeon]